MTQNVQSLQVRRLTFAGLSLALALVLPFLTGQIPEIGSMLCPMHLPVLLCGFACGWGYGLGVGLVAPVLRSLIFGMPKLYPTALAMCFELATYGAVAGLLYRAMPRRPLYLYVELALTMIAGRVVWGIAQYALLFFQGKTFTMELFIAGAVTTAIPGIILQFVLIPALIMVLQKAGLTFNQPGGHAASR